jgi:hypothetical protein
MSGENVEIVRAFYERFARGDFDALAGFSDDRSPGADGSAGL